MDVIDQVVFKEMGTLNLPLHPLKACLLGTPDKRVDVQPGDEREVYTHILDMAQPFPPQRHQREILNVEVRASKEDKKCTPEVEFNPLPSHLRQEFLGPNETFPVIISPNLDRTQIAKLLCVLKNIELP